MLLDESIERRVSASALSGSPDPANSTMALAVSPLTISRIALIDDCISVPLSTML
jgi:hypothetical protein